MASQGSAGARRARSFLPVVFAALVLAIAAVAYLAHARARAGLLAEKANELRAIADLKVSQIVAWRAERLGDARVVAGDPLLVAAVGDWLAGGARAERGAALQARLASLREAYGYERVSLLDGHGGLRLTAPVAELGHVAIDELTRQALATPEVSLLDLHRPDTGEGIHLELVAPLRLAGDHAARPVAFLVFQGDPHRFLYPLVQSWPTPSRSAETLLVRREGREVVYLNELRHRKGTALALRLPVAQPDLPAALAVQGAEGVVEGVDYRGQRVLAALRRVPDSPWFLVSKLDRQEIVAPLAREAWLTALLAVALIALAGLGAQRFWRREREASDAELRESEARLRLQGAALEAAADAVMITDREGRIVWVNEAFCRLTGWSLEACQGKTPRILKSGHHEQRFYEDLWRTILGGAVWKHEMVNRRKDGSPYVEEQTITPVYCRRGEITHFIAIKIDMTDRRETEKALRESEERYRSLFDSMHDGFAYCRMVFEDGRPRDFVYLEVNRAFETLTGLKSVVGRKVTEAIPGIRETNPELFEIYGRVALTGEPERFETYVEPLGIWFDISVYSPAKEHFVAVFADITKRKRAEDAILKEKAFSESMINSLPGIFYLFDSTGRFIRWNQAFEVASGYSPAEIARMSPLDFFVGEGRDLIGRRIQAVFGEGKADAEADFVSKDGRRTPYYFVGVRTEVAGTPCCIGMGIDITDRRLLESQLQQAQKMEAIGQLASGVAHDFNNLLNVIGGYSAMVLQGLPPDHPQRKRIEEIRKAGERAAGLTRQLLAFGRRQTMAPVVLDLSQVVSGLEGMLRRLIPEHIQIVTVFDSGAARVKADPGQLEQVILNLAVNARDAMPDGGRMIIEVSPTELDETYCRGHSGVLPGRYVLLAVSDSGTGMDAETQARIFEPFFTTKDVGRGTGMGLATVYGIVKQHEGHVWVYSELGRGTTFKVYLPRVDDVVACAKEAAPPLEARSGSETVLLVEDDESVRELNREVLEDLGYRVLEARDGEAALTASERHEGNIHLLLTDMVMPRMTGRQLADRLRASRPGIRVLFVSGYTSDVVVRGGDLDAGTAFLQKPFTPDSLGRKIRQVLGAPA